MSPLVEGVGVNCFDDAERTLRSLADQYQQADLSRKKACRTLVISAKDKLRWWLRRAARKDERRPEKEEILLWVGTWLENPALFADWIAIRRRRIAIEPRRLHLDYIAVQRSRDLRLQILLLGAGALSGV